MRTLLIVLSNALTVIAAIPYIIQILKGNTKPRLASWFTWSAIVAIAAVASFSQHQIPAAIFALFCSLECAAVVILGLRHADTHLEKIDLVSFGGAIIGLITLLLLKSPTLAVVACIATDFIGALTTIRHSWIRPWEETWSTYALNAVGSAMTLAVANFHFFTAIGYPLYLVILEVALTIIILCSPNRLRNPALMTRNLAPSGFGNPAFATSPPPVTTLINQVQVSSPAIPTNLTISSPTQVPVLVWAPADAAARYNIYRNGLEIGTSQLPTYADSTALQGSYSYHVTAVNPAGESAPSNDAAVTVDRIPPHIVYTTDIQPNENGWFNQPVIVTFSATDDMVGVAACSPPVKVDQDGNHLIITGSAMNFAGDSSTTTAVINIDQTPPSLGQPAWTRNPVMRNLSTSLSVPVVDHTSGTVQGEYIGSVDPGLGRGVPMLFGNGLLTSVFNTNVPPGRHTVNVRAKDAAGNWSELISTDLMVM